MVVIAAAEASASHMAHKRERQDIQLQESGDDQHKRPRHNLLSEILFEEDLHSLYTIEDETVLHVIKSLEEEISTIPEISAENVDVGKIEAIYEYLVSATDDELGIPPSPPASLQENDGQHISQNMWNDLFENSSDQKVDLL